MGDTRHPGFGQKIDSNLIFYDEFNDAKQSLEHIWTPDSSLFGEGNDGFAYYTPQNIDIRDGTLRIQPGLFADLGMIETEAGHTKYNATDVMTGNCIPFPECATKGFGPDDAPMGCRVPPMGRERDQKERTPVFGKGPYAESSSRNAPFDRPFYLIFNLAVGGAQNGCPDPNYWGENAIWCRHSDDFASDLSASTLFWSHRDQWLTSWDAAKMDKREAFTIDWVKIWQ